MPLHFVIKYAILHMLKECKLGVGRKVRSFLWHQLPVQIGIRKENTMEKVTELTARLAAPIIEEQGCSLWDVEYVKEAGTWYLRVLIDKEGGVDILDCEAISRQLSDLLDEADPIEGSYTLEVGSAGAERALKRPADFQRYLGSPVLVKLYKPVDGRKEFPGTLTAYNEADGSVTVDLNGSAYTFGKKDVALCRLRVEF